MLTLCNSILQSDCLVVGIRKHFVYPIFRVASTSLIAESQRSYLNKEIQKECADIQIFIRDPEARFISGVNQYSRQHGIGVQDTWEKACNDKLVDQHFVPQYIWLVHLRKYYNGLVTLRPFSDVDLFTQKHRGHETKDKKTPVDILRKFVDVDFKLLKLINKSIELDEIVRRFKNEMS